MRKEFSQARFLSIAQNQLLRAHDELKMSISRMKLKEKDDEPSEVNIVTREELIPYNVQFTSDKFVSLSSLARIRGQLRYLQVSQNCLQNSAVELYISVCNLHLLFPNTSSFFNCCR
jgi:E3 ubiquitin-protein ligase SHPRH